MLGSRSFPLILLVECGLSFAFFLPRFEILRFPDLLLVLGILAHVDARRQLRKCRSATSKYQ
jgi:hypothetical protein